MVRLLVSRLFSIDLAVVIRGVRNTTEKEIEESIRASENSVTSTETDSKTPRPVTSRATA